MAWTKTSVGTHKLHTYLVSPLTAYADTTPVASETIEEHIGGNGYALIGVNKTIAGNAVTVPLHLQASIDNSNWITVLQVSANITPNSTGLVIYSIDLTAYSYPYYRLYLNGTAAAVGTTGRFYFVYCGRVGHGLIHHNMPV